METRFVIEEEEEEEEAKWIKPQSLLIILQPFSKG